MTATDDPSVLFSLKLQHNALTKQPLIIKRRQEETLLRTESVANSPPWTTKTKPDHGKEVLLDINTHATIQNVGVAIQNNGVDEEDAEQRFSLEEAYNSLEETRPLLECLRQHSQSGDGDNLKYFAGDILEAYDEKSLTPDEEKKVFLNGRKMPKGDQDIIEELQMQNKELCQHIVRLVQNMDHCERENRKLKSRVSYLEQELETMRSQSTSSEASFREELGAPFSLPVCSSASTVSSVSTPPAEIPPLPPLELPDFDVK